MQNKPQNPKHATSKPIKVIQGFREKNVGYELFASGNIKLYGIRNGERRIDYIQPEEFADMIWKWMGQTKNSLI